MSEITATMVEAAYREGFEAGADHNNISYKYPPQNIAWRFSDARQRIAGAQLGPWPEWTPAGWSDVQDESDELGTLTNWPSPSECIATIIRDISRRIPLGGSVRIRGSEPISGYNLAEHVARIVEQMAVDRDVYGYFCDEPEKATPAPKGQPE